MSAAGPSGDPHRDSTWKTAPTRDLELLPPAILRLFQQELLKLQYKDMFFRTKGKVPPWGLPATDFFAELLGKEV